MEKYIIDSITEKITIDDKEVLFNEIPKFRDNKISTLVGDIEITKPKISYSKEDTFNAGDTYINPANVAYLYTGDGWVKIGKLRQQLTDVRNSIASGYDYSLFLLSDGTVKSWGGNGYGKLGDGTTTDRYTPVLVSGITNCVSVSAGSYHSLFLLSDGTVKACGYNYLGQLGDGTTTDRYTPVLVSGVTNCVVVGAGNVHSLFLLADGTVKACGQNNYGQLGTGDTTNRSIPVLVSGVSGVSKCVNISCGCDHSLFLLSDGTVKGCGSNTYGQLGNSDTTSKSTPVLVSIISDCIGVSAGYYHSLFLLEDGTVKAGGYNYYGQLGDGTANTYSGYNPVVLVSGVSGCIRVSAGTYHSSFLLSDGTVKACGTNYYGQLGDDTTTTRYTPVLVSGVSGCIFLISNFCSYNTFFLLTDGTFKACGYNNKGQLGDGTTTQRNTPVVTTINNVKEQVYPDITVFDLK